MKKVSKRWAFAGASLGVVAPVGMRIYEVVQLDNVPTAISYLFWPTILLIMITFTYPIASMLLSLLGNALPLAQ